MKLEAYNQKRDFSKTKEPPPVIIGGISNSKLKKQDLHFVIQHHLASREHYDFRLEHNGVLLSWAIPKMPSQNPKDKRLAIHVEDHPLEYRHFEGEIPKGQYGGGTVSIWDKGLYKPLSSMSKGMKDGLLKFILYGEKLTGEWKLVRTNLNNKKENWLLIKAANNKTAARVALYSLRAKESAPVSILISRSQLDKTAPKDVSIYETIKKPRAKTLGKNFLKLNKNKD